MRARIERGRRILSEALPLSELRRFSGASVRDRLLKAVVNTSIIVEWFAEAEGCNRAWELEINMLEAKWRSRSPGPLSFGVLSALHYKRLFAFEELRSVAEACDA